MSLAVIIDIVIVVSVVAFALHGAKRGLFQSLAGLVIVVVALFGAAIIAGTFAKPVAKLVTPMAEKYFSQEIAEALERVDVELPDMDIVPELPEDGVLKDVMASAGTILEGAVDTATTTASAAAENLIESIAYSILFMIGFLLLMLLLHVLCAAMGLLTKLPVVHGLNSLGGAVFGLVQGVLLVFLVVFVLQHLGVALDTAELQEAHILHIFRDNTLLEKLLSLL